MKLNANNNLQSQMTVLHNFVETDNNASFYTKGEYVLYFGRYSKEKGITTLLEACKQLPDIPFIFAGSGPLECEIANISNIKNVGFKSGTELTEAIRKARFSIFPSEVYENCPFSILESISFGTPVIGANLGGIPELIDSQKNGELFESGNADDLTEKIETLWKDTKLCELYQKQCSNTSFDTISEYCEKLLKIYNS
jgi:glycosyltransferase involved in cell wall biosynthesis